MARMLFTMASVCNSVLCYLYGKRILMQLYALESYGVYILHTMMPIFVFCVLHLFTLIF